MHVVVNKLKLARPFDEDLLRRMREEFFVGARKYPEFVDLHVVRVSDAEVILLVYFTTREALDRSTTEFAAPWFAANVRSYLAGPADRSVGEVIAQARPG